MLFNTFHDHLRDQLSVSTKHHILVATSGGVDSMVLVHLLLRCGCQVGLAHCNFNLRGEASRADELFVQAYAHGKGLRYHVCSFDTEEYARLHGVSIEMAARTLRYDWFEGIRVSGGYDVIATAHHQNDNAETLVLNLVRGTGIRGLLGIHNTPTIIRPLLVATRRQVEDYAHHHAIAFCTDASNLENVYSRNKIRNSVIPVLEQINPSLIATINKDIARFNEAFRFYNHHVSAALSRLVSVDGLTQRVSIVSIKEHEYGSLLAYEWLQVYGFNRQVVNDMMIALLSVQPGRCFYSATHRLVIERHHLLLAPREQVRQPVLVQQGCHTILFGTQTFRFEFITGNQVTISRHADQACIDARHLVFPLIVRTWREGDAFVPLGMQHHKKLSDFFIDKKIDLSEKSSIPLLVNGNGDIIWVVGLRLSDCFKITPATDMVLRVTLVNNGATT